MAIPNITPEEFRHLPVLPGSLVRFVPAVTLEEAAYRVASHRSSGPPGAACAAARAQRARGWCSNAPTRASRWPPSPAPRANRSVAAVWRRSRGRVRGSPAREQERMKPAEAQIARAVDTW